VLDTGSLPNQEVIDPFCNQLGGKDPAYVRQDANLDYTVAELVDGNILYPINSEIQSDMFLKVHSSTLARVAAPSK
jgi:hypothetical protein